MVPVCSSKSSKECTSGIEISQRAYDKNIERNNGNYICFYCSRKDKYSGRNNPNCKHLLDDNFFEKIDTTHKSYVLGWIASDGHISPNGTVRIEIHEKDEEVLRVISSNIGNLPIHRRDSRSMVSISFCSKKMTLDISKHLGIIPGPKSFTVKFPNLETDDLKWAFIRGYFDGDGSICEPSENRRSPRCNITCYSPYLLNSISEFVKIPHCKMDSQVEFNGHNALDFLSKIYDNCGQDFLARKFDLYQKWAMWQPSLPGVRGRNEHFSFSKTRPDAVAPAKARASDSGYDLVILEPIKSYGNTILYDTGIKVKPSYGWYFDLVARSSLIKTGWMLANGIGVIDMGYTGNIMVPLIKVDPNAKDLELPGRYVQLVPRPICHARFVEEDIDESSRSSGGFGSTGR